MSSSVLDDEGRYYLSPKRQQSSSLSFHDQQTKGGSLSAAISDQETAWPAAASTSTASKSFEDEASDFLGGGHASARSSTRNAEDIDPFASELPNKTETTFSATEFEAQAFSVQAGAFGSESQRDTFSDVGLDTKEVKTNDKTVTNQKPVSSAKGSEFSRKAPASQPSGDFFGSFSSFGSDNKSKSQRSSPGSRAPADPDGMNTCASSITLSRKPAQFKSHRDFVDPFGIEPKRSTSTDFGSFSDTQSKASSKLASMAKDAEKQIVNSFHSDDLFATSKFEEFDEASRSAFSAASIAARNESDHDGLASFRQDADDVFFGSSKSDQSTGSRNTSHVTSSKHSRKSHSTGSSDKSTSESGVHSRASSRSRGRGLASGSRLTTNSSRRGSLSKVSPKLSFASRTSSQGSQSSQSASKKGSRMSISEFLPPGTLAAKGPSVVSGLTSKDAQTLTKDDPSISLSEVFPSLLSEGTSPAPIQKSDQMSNDLSNQQGNQPSESTKESMPSRSSKRSSQSKFQDSKSVEDGRSEASTATSSSKGGHVDSLSFDSALVDSSKNSAGFTSFADSASGLGTIMETQDVVAEKQTIGNEFGASFNFDDQHSRSTSNSAVSGSRGIAGSQSTSVDPSNQENRHGSNDGSLSGLSFSRSSWSKATTKPSEGSGRSLSVSSESRSSSNSNSSYASESMTSRNQASESASSGVFSQSDHSSTGSSFFSSRQSSETHTFSQSVRSGNFISQPSTTTNEKSDVAASFRSSRSHFFEESRSSRSLSQSQKSSTDRSDISSRQGVQTNQASSGSDPTSSSEPDSFGGSSAQSEASSKGRSSPSSAKTSSRSSNSRPSSFRASSRPSESSPRSLKSRASSFGQDSRSLSRRSSHFSATDQSRQSRRNGGSNGKSGRSRASSSSRQRGAPQSAGDSSHEGESRSSRSSIFSFGEQEKSRTNLFDIEESSRRSGKSPSQQNRFVITNRLESSFSSQNSRTRRKGTVGTTRSQIPEVLFFGKSVSFLKDTDPGLELKNKAIHATVNSCQYKNMVSLAYRKLCDLRPRLRYIISEAEWVHVHILLLYARLFECELHHHNILLPKEFQIEIPKELHVLEPIACVLASVGIVKDEQSGATYIPVAKPYDGKSEYTPHNPDDVTEFLEWTVKDGLGYDWNASWEEVERWRDARKQLAIEQGIKLPVNESKWDKEEKHQQKLLDWNLLAIEKWLGYDDELWFSYQQACHVLSRVAEFILNPREQKTGSYAWLLPREETQAGELLVRVPRPSLTADTWMIALMLNFCALPLEHTCTWYLESRPMKDIDSLMDIFLEAALKHSTSSSPKNDINLEQ
jgi:hypothetical protein